MPDHETIEDSEQTDDAPEGVVTEDHATDESDMVARDRGGNAEKTGQQANFRADEDESPPS